MALVFGPRHYEQQSEMYHQLAAMTTAGLGIMEACAVLQRSPPQRRMAQAFASIQHELKSGRTFSEALRCQKNWLPDFDIALIEAAEISGRLDTSFRMLSEYYAERSRLVRRVMSELAWPVFTMHMAILVFPTDFLVGFVLRGQLNEFLLQKLQVLVPLYAVVFAFIYAGQARHGAGWRGLLERVLHYVPMLGRARRDLAMARLCGSLEALLSAGMPILESWMIAGNTCGSVMLRNAIHSWTPHLRSGATPAEMLQQSPQFPNVFTSLYHTGEISGQLDTTLRRLYTMFSEESSRRFHAFSQWLPRMIMLAIMLGIAYQIVRFWLNYYNSVGQAIGV